jgi:hypothetical protein
MSWHTINDCAPSTVSRGQEEEYSQTFCLDTYLSELAKSRSTPETCSCKDSATESYQCSQSGTTSERCEGNSGAGMSMSSRADFLAQTSAAQEQTTTSVESKWDSMAVIVDCGRKCVESLAKYGLRLRSSKTVLISEVRDLTECSKTLTRWGIMRNGVCLGLGTLERTTSGTEYGCLLPTPTCHNAKEGAYPAEHRRKSPTLAATIGGKINPTWNESRMMWPQGWTQIGASGLKQSAMDSTLEWRHSHGVSCRNNTKKEDTQ